MGFLDALKRMGNNCLKSGKTQLVLPQNTSLDHKTMLISPKKTGKKSCYAHRRLGSTASTVSGDDIKLVWANNKDSSTLFDQLGAKDIFKRFNKFLDDWKVWQDQEKQCKKLLGFDVEKQLMESLCLIPSGMRIGLSYGCTTEDYDFYLEVEPSIQLNELSEHLFFTIQKAMEVFKILAQQMKTLTEQGKEICQDLIMILDYLDETMVDGFEIPTCMQHLDNPEQLKEALLLVKGVVLTLKSYGTTITNYIMQQGHNVDIAVANKKSSNPKLIVYPKQVAVTKIKVREMDEQTFVALNVGEDDEKYIEISFK